MKLFAFEDALGQNSKLRQLEPMDQFVDDSDSDDDEF